MLRTDRLPQTFRNPNHHYIANRDKNKSRKIKGHARGRVFSSLKFLDDDVLPAFRFALSKYSSSVLFLSGPSIRDTEVKCALLDRDSPVRIPSANRARFVHMVNARESKN